MKYIKKFFRIEKPYTFERMDIAALMSILNTLAIIIWNKGAYIGLPVNVIGLGLDLREHCHINCVLMRLSLIIMNIYFLTL